VDNDVAPKIRMEKGEAKKTKRKIKSIIVNVKKFK